MLSVTHTSVHTTQAWFYNDEPLCEERKAIFLQQKQQI
jgi:hypothetical protein